MSLFNNAITGAAGQQGYTISRSVRLRSSASAYFNRTQTSGNRRTYTYSAWVKRGNLASKQNLFGTIVYPTPSNYQSYWSFLSDNTFDITFYSGSSYLGQLITTQVFRDPSAWYHIVVQVDTTQATSSNRVKLFVNGTQVTSFSTTNYPAQNTDTFINTDTYQVGIGRVAPYNTTEYFDGYMTEINFIDGQALTPSSFGETDSITGVWKAKKYTGTYGTNGFYLNFSDNSSNTATTIGKDYSGNGNNWTPNNISVTSGVTYDSMVDSPTVSAVSSNYCVLNPLATGVTVVNGNLDFTYTAANRSVLCTMGINTGKWRWEFTPNGPNNNYDLYAGIIKASATFTPTSNEVRFNANVWGVGNLYGGSTQVRPVNNNTFGTSLGWTWTNGDVLGLYFDATNGTLKANQNGGSLVTVYTGLTTGIDWLPIFSDGSVASATHATNYGQRPFAYATVDSTYNALNTYNLPASTITNGAAYMAATTYTGTGSTQSITNTVGSTSFQPDFVWIKSRSNAENHNIVDSIRGAGVWLASNLFQGETNDTGSYGVSTFNSNGFTVISNGTRTNASGYTYVGWQWKAGGTAVSNTDGTITTTVSANPSSGFSVMTYTGTGIDNKTIGHGLGAAPKFIIWKPRASATDWMVWHAGLSGYNYDVRLNTTAAQGTGANPLNNTAPSSTVITLRNQGDVNGSGTTIVCYAFSAVKGFSAFGSYTGNGSTDGPFVYTGFRPRFVLTKCSNGYASYWTIIDTGRNTSNVSSMYALWPNGADAESAAYDFDILSNGFKIRATTATLNQSGATYIYACFAENPFKNALAR